MPRLAILTLLLLFLASFSAAGPPTREQTERWKKVVAELKESLAAESTDEAKFAHIGKAMADERDVILRTRILEVASTVPGPELEAFLTERLASDGDAGLRSRAAEALGRTGSEECLEALTKAAESDPTTEILFGDIGGQSSARRAAIYAIADLAVRFPKIADDAAGKLRELPYVEDPADNESLADARRQALYQITQDTEQLEPFFERLKSDDAKVRQDGVIAFSWLKLTNAPGELVDTLKDDDLDVRRTAAMVLGRIGDPKTADVLMEVAADAKADRSVRVNAIWSLGHMRAKVAGDLMEKLLEDSNVSVNAAISLYRITGKKVKEFPEGYNAE